MVAYVSIVGSGIPPIHRGQSGSIYPSVGNLEWWDDQGGDHAIFTMPFLPCLDHGTYDDMKRMIMTIIATNYVLI